LLCSTMINAIMKQRLSAFSSRGQMGQKKQNILFLCYGNLNRSPTATDICRKIAKQKNLEINAVSAGIAGYAENPLTKDAADQADMIFVMEDYMQTLLQEHYGQKPEKIICLNIPDIYPRNDPELIRILAKELSYYL
jgi:predicted protein tyrosine phosphatase